MDIARQIESHCTHPKLIEVFNPVTREKELREIPCGCCYHCKMTRINEWVTRMVLESKYRVHTYFVTLTYDNATASVETLSDTYPVWHNINKRRKYDFQPLVLVKSHLQKFIKRLRKHLDFPIKYYAVGEYGHTYGRPHYHLILWSDLPITKEDIEDSWSLHGNLIGNIDFDDLHITGTIDSCDSFKYVCKYLHKQDYDIFNSPTKKFHYEHLQKSFVGNFDNQRDAKCAYRKKFSPFALCSKQPAIGYDYFTENRTRFEQRDFRLLGLTDSEFIFPAYFYRKT